MKKYIIALIPFIIAAGCMIAYNIIGSEVAPDGTLIEPFYLVGIGSFATLIGIISLVIIGIVNLVSFCKNNKRVC